MTVAIRQARLTDESAIRRCAELAYARYIPRMGRKPAPLLTDFAALIAAGRVHVAEGNHGRFQGYIAFWPDGRGMFLDSVVVMPELAGQGLGRHLIAFCEGRARDAGLALVHLYTNAKMTENLAIYPRLGYHETGRRSENGYDRVFFEKALE